MWLGDSYHLHPPELPQEFLQVLAVSSLQDSGDLPLRHSAIHYLASKVGPFLRGLMALRGEPHLQNSRHLDSLGGWALLQDAKLEPVRALPYRHRSGPPDVPPGHPHHQVVPYPRRRHPRQLVLVGRMPER